MNLADLYKSKLMSADVAVTLVKDGWSLAVPVGVGQPPVLINALARRIKDFTHIGLFSVVDVYPTEMMKMGRDDPFVLDYSYCIASRSGVKDGRYVYTPSRLSEAPLLPEFKRPMHALMLQVSPMDEHGYFSMGLSCDYIMTLRKQAQLVIIQVNEKMPRTFGNNFFHISEVDAIVEATHPLAALPAVAPNENEKLIGQYIAELVEDGSCIQLGIGGIPAAAALALENKKDLGVHTEMLADSMRVLWEKGIITNRHKKFMPNVSVATFALGTQELYDWASNNPAVQFYPCDMVNDPYVIAQNDKVVSINSAIEIDLSGQVCAESIGPVQYTHMGGQPDFALGAVRSKGGKGIIATESMVMTKNGPISKISGHLKLGSFVTTARYDIQYVVTEYGIAYLKGQTIRERAKRLIAIAHPDFRDQLTFEGKKANFL